MELLLAYLISTRHADRGSYPVVYLIRCFLSDQSVSLPHLVLKQFMLLKNYHWLKNNPQLLHPAYIARSRGLKSLDVENTSFSQDWQTAQN
jgi:hypothetical protein